LQEEGKLSVQDRLSKFFPDFPRADKITIENLLTHTSGLHNYTDIIDENDSAIISNPVPKEQVLQAFENSPLLFKPGKKFDYNNSGYFLLGMIIEKVTGKQYETVAREMIFSPLEMSHSGFDYKNLPDTNKSQGYDFLDNEKIRKNITVDSTVYFSAGAMYSTVGDLLKFASGLMSHQLINDSSMQQAFTPFKENYGYGFYVDSLIGRQYIRHSGGLPGFVSEFIYYPNEDVTIILLNNVGYYGSSLFPVATGISGILFGLPTKNWQQPKAMKLDDTILTQYVGTYRYNPQTDLIVSFKDGKLFILCTNPKAHLPKVQLYPESNTVFFMKEAPLKFEFSPDATTHSLKLTTYNSFGKDADWIKIK
jgi:CubicO group peptidase (beta-lactamase class C family)